MNVRTLTIVATAAIVSLGCDKIPFLNKLGQAGQEEAAPDTTTATDTTTTPAPAPPPATAPAEDTPEPDPEPAARPEPDPQPRPVARQRPSRSQSRDADDEVPWNPEFTGTVRPGMTPEEVVEEWGAMARWFNIEARRLCHHFQDTGHGPVAESFPDSAAALADGTEDRPLGDPCFAKPCVKMLHGIGGEIADLASAFLIGLGLAKGDGAGAIIGAS